MMIPTKHSERAATAAADMLMDFTDALFYNFKTSEASQKAFSCVAEELSICRAVVCISSANGATAPRVLFESGAPVGDSPRIEEKSLRAFDGKIYSYRVYRKQDAEPLHFVQRRMLEFVFKLLHTYLNRQTNLEMNQYARTHDLVYECLNTNGLSETFKQYKQAGFEFTDYAVVFMNVCKFKAINEKVGFENGNKVLRFIVSSLNNMLTGDEFFARIGGDNFTLFLRQENLQHRLDALNSMVCMIPIDGRNIPVELNFRMGVYPIAPYMTDTTEMVENASIAYSFARESGMDDIAYFNEETRSRYEFRKMVESSFRSAMLGGEFRIYLQPKVDLSNYRIVGAEALSRWMHDGKLIRPDTYVPLLERTGRITQVDFYVYEQTCQLLRSWMDAGEPVVGISVNFSKISLETPGFTDKLLHIAAKYDVSPEYLQVEFTESCCMEDDCQFNDILCTLKKHGFSVSLDDFGKGYSSINMIRNMNFDVLKLDKSFHSVETGDAESGRIILRSIIRMAQNLGIAVLSEGVETAEQTAFLKELKCEQAQGYYFDKPLTPEDFLERLRIGGYEKD